MGFLTGRGGDESGRKEKEEEKGGGCKSGAQDCREPEQAPRSPSPRPMRRYLKSQLQRRLAAELQLHPSVKSFTVSHLQERIVCSSCLDSDTFTEALVQHTI
ncbi:hypothetical protein EYF80_060109 [Liparis tanakae]|uniref:Uncharacterized protein n=1 Tax=Liparis tanakae TaxID=230148 RepID=A0A4Z2EMY3_9TELE|nr:hypothetical protein EYF80_060109 [Liparis tanakae]